MKRTVWLLAAALAVPAGGCGGVSNSIEAAAQPATVRLPLAPGRPGVAYLSLRAQGDRGALVSVTSPRIGRIEMHETMSSGSMSSMRPLQRIPIRDGEEIAFVPGGRHLMLFDMDPGLRPGDTLTLSFSFERGAPERLRATVVAANDQH